MLAAALAAHLAATVFGLTFNPAGPGGNVFVAHMPPAPDVAVAVMPAGGDWQPDRTGHDIPAIQIIVRGAPHDPHGSFEAARAIYSELTGLGPAVLDPGGPDEVFLIGATAVQSAPVPLGPDGNDRPEWSLNFRCHIHAPTVHRPV